MNHCLIVVDTNYFLFVFCWHTNIYIGLNIDDVETAIGDLDKPDSIEKAMVDVDIIFLNTFFNLMNETAQDEIRRGINVINAIKKHTDNIKHIIYSSIPDLAGNEEAKPKQEIENRLETLVSNISTSNDIGLSFIYPTFYFENFVTVWPLSKHLFTGEFHWWMLPFDKQVGLNTEMGHVAIEDLGGLVAGLIKYKWERNTKSSNTNGHDEKKADSKYSEKDFYRVFAISQMIKVEQILKDFSQVLGSQVYFEPLTMKQFDCMPLLNDETKKALKWYANPGDNVGMSVMNKWNDKLKQEIPKCEYLWKLVYFDENKGENTIEMKTCITWAKENKEKLESGGEFGQVFPWLKRIAKTKAFVKKPIVSLSIVAGLSGTALYFYDKKYKKFGLFS